MIDGRWMHPEDKDVLVRKRHPFNLDHPVSPFVGDLRAEVVILGANGGYSDATPRDFARPDAVAVFLAQVAEGCNMRWAMQQGYYQNRRYSAALEAGRVVVVNACAYRSRNRPALGRIRLPSVAFHEDWLLNVIGPLAHRGERLVVAWRPGLWKDVLRALGEPGVVPAGNPRMPDLTSAQWGAVEAYLRRRNQ